MYSFGLSFFRNTMYNIKLYNCNSDSTTVKSMYQESRKLMHVLFIASLSSAPGEKSHLVCQSCPLTLSDWLRICDMVNIRGWFGLGVQNEAEQRQVEFCQENALVISNTLFQQHKRRFYTWTSPDAQYWNQIDYTLWTQRWRSSILSAKTRLGADYGSDHKLLIAKFRLKLKKVGKTTRPFRYDWNQINYSGSDK